jgi:hypothetical protein
MCTLVATKCDTTEFRVYYCCVWFRPKHKHMTDTSWSKHAVAWKTTQSSLTHSSAPTSGVSLAVSLWVRMGCLCVRFWRARPSYISIIYADITSRPLAFSGWPLLLHFDSDNVRQREGNTSNRWVINTSWWGLTPMPPNPFLFAKERSPFRKVRWGKVRWGKVCGWVLFGSLVFVFSGFYWFDSPQQKLVLRYYI